jgi:hypothetical protein
MAGRRQFWVPKSQPTACYHIASVPVSRALQRCRKRSLERVLRNSRLGWPHRAARRRRSPGWTKSSTHVMPSHTVSKTGIRVVITQRSDDRNALHGHNAPISKNCADYLLDCCPATSRFDGTSVVSFRRAFSLFRAVRALLGIPRAVLSPRVLRPC